MSILKHWIAILALATVAAGCGDDGSSGVDGAVVDSGQSGDAGNPNALLCEDYCTKIMANCTGDNAQYADKAACLGMCTSAAAWEAGEADAQNGNSIACRTYHAGDPATSDPVTHCPHAGPSGGGQCGSFCENYCHVARKNCTGENEVHDSLQACLSVCELLPTNGEVDATDGHSVQCRIYHASAPAADDPATHCPHVDLSGGNQCGTWCEAYCDLNAKTCTGDNAQYTNRAECLDKCADFADTGSPGDEMGNTVQCRIHHSGLPAIRTPDTECTFTGQSPADYCIDVSF